MSKPKPGKASKYFGVKNVVTHNSVAPFSTAMAPGEVGLYSVTITGERDGPSLYVGGGQHGDEIGGMVAAWELAQKVDYRKLRGRLVVVPLQNPGGFRFRSRLNPYDPIDPDWIHPGDPNGSHYQRTKYILGHIASSCDCVIDLHTAGLSGANSGYVYVPPELGNGAGTRSLDLALAFGGDRIIQGESEDTYGWPVANTLPFVANREGRLGLYPEAGQGGGLAPERRYVDYLVTGVLNVMQKMRMIKGGVTRQGERRVVDPTSEKAVKATSDGLLRTFIEPGARVRKGELIAEICLIPSGLVKVTAPIDANVIFLLRYGAIGKGETIATLSPM